MVSFIFKIEDIFFRTLKKGAFFYFVKQPSSKLILLESWLTRIELSMIPILHYKKLSL